MNVYEMHAYDPDPDRTEYYDPAINSIADEINMDPDTLRLRGDETPTDDLPWDDAYYSAYLNAMAHDIERERALETIAHVSFMLWVFHRTIASDWSDLLADAYHTLADRG